MFIHMLDIFVMFSFFIVDKENNINSEKNIFPDYITRELTVKAISEIGGWLGVALLRFSFILNSNPNLCSIGLIYRFSLLWLSIYLNLNKMCFF